jgi:hypothetical protein
MSAGTGGVMKKIFFVLFFVFILILMPIPSLAKTIYLDNFAGVINADSTYDPVSRTNGSGNATVYTNLQNALNALQGGDTLYVRSGYYTRNGSGYYEGALHVAVSGTSSQPTTIAAYGNEQPVIYTQTGKMQYNPNPGDISFTNSSHYYPWPAISISGKHIVIKGFKTFGQVAITGSQYVTIQNCDLGGGGPALNQGQVVFIKNSWDILIRNNYIHNSSWGESDANGAALMGYEFAATIENNEFYDNWGPDIRLKDTVNMNGRTTIIRNNYFRRSAIRPKNNGISGIAQYPDIDYVYIYNNIFFQKGGGISWDTPANLGTVAYNNTFVDCDVDITNWVQTSINSFNNLFYHSVSNKEYYNIQANPLSLLRSDFNLYYSSIGDTRWVNNYNNSSSSLSSWKTYSGRDAGSVSKNPGFVNVTGNQPGDFKRISYSGDVQSSPYGAVCGAYTTGTEVVGVGAGALPIPPPSPPPATKVPSPPANITIP